jgi:glycosyltransferase involved in cell wall biosynthesis
MGRFMADKRTLAVLIPCLNEEKGIASVVSEYRRAFPEARILVVDNGSTDSTARVARDAGAEVIQETRRGKARAVATAFGLIDEDFVLMVDGDGSYPAEGAHLLFPFCEQGADMATGLRTPTGDQSPVFRRFHRGGSALFHSAMRLVFGYAPGDLFSGLRLFSRRFYKSVPILFRGFELETELTIQAVEKEFRVAEVAVPFRERSEGTVSKLRTVHDGFRILRLILVLFRDYRPFEFFALVSAFFFIAGLAAGYLPVREYFQTHLVGRFPLAILAAALMNLALFSLLTGVMLESGLRHRREAWQIQLRNFRG